MFFLCCLVRTKRYILPKDHVASYRFHVFPAGVPDTLLMLIVDIRGRISFPTGKLNFLLYICRPTGGNLTQACQLYKKLKVLNLQWHKILAFFLKDLITILYGTAAKNKYVV